MTVQHPILRARPRISENSVSSGIRDMVPMMLAALPFGLTIGASIVETAIDNVAGWLGGPLIAAGSAHLAVVTLIDGPASGVAVVLTALIINARLAGYSAALAATFRGQPAWFRWLASYFLIDQTFALATTKLNRPASWFRRYYLAAMLTLLLPWIVAISVGMVAGPILPESWDLWLAAPLMFAGMTASAATDRPAVIAASVAGGSALLLAGLPSGTGLLVAIVAGALAGARASRERRS